MIIKKDMIVKVISGANKGQEGKVLFVNPKKNRLIVEGVNFIKNLLGQHRIIKKVVSSKKKLQSIFLMLWFCKIIKFLELGIRF